MTTLRAFIAIDLSPEARQALTILQNRLKTLAPPHTVRWSAPQNIHLTLHFLGEITPEQANEALDQLTAATACYPAFEIALAGLGCFPNTKRPRVLWVGMPQENEILLRLQQNLGGRLQAAIDFSPETRPFSPHLTLGRVKKGIPARHLNQLSQVITQEVPGVGQIARLKVQQIILYKSDLNPTGAVYTRLGWGELST
jgi:2'-5' RNA ligase